MYGLRDQKPIANIPPEAIEVVTVLEKEKAGKAIVKFADHYEEWVLGYEGNTFSADRWTLKWKNKSAFLNL